MATRYRFRVEEFEKAFQGVPHVELLEVHRDPRGGRYREIRLLSPEEEVSPALFPEVRLPWA